VSEQGSSFPYGGKQTVYDNGIRSAAFLRWPGKVAAGTSSDALMQYVDVAPTFIAVAGGDPDAIDTGCPNRAGGSGFDGRSFLGALVGGAEIFRDVIYAQHTTVGLNGYTKPYPCRAVRDSRYKLIRNLAPQNAFVFDRIDPDQGGNLPWRYGVMLDAWRVDAADDPSLARRIERYEHRPAEELYDLQVDPLETTNLADDAAFASIRARLRAKLDGWMEQQGDLGMETELKALSRQPRSAAKE